MHDRYQTYRKKSVTYKFTIQLRKKIQGEFRNDGKEFNFVIRFGLFPDRK